METKTYYTNNGHERIGLFAGCLLMAMSLAMIYFGIANGKFRTIGDVFLIGGLCCFLWLLSGYILYNYLRRKEVRLVINADGIEIVTPFMGERRIPWSEIETTYVRQVRRSLVEKAKILCLQVRHPQEVVDVTQTKWQKHISQSNWDLYGTPVVVTEDTFDIPIEDLQLEIENRLYARRKASEAASEERLPDVPDAQPLRLAIGNR